MRERFLPGAYVGGTSRVHRLPVGAKLLLLVAYLVALTVLNRSGGIATLVSAIYLLDQRLQPRLRSLWLPVLLIAILLALQAIVADNPSRLFVTATLTLVLKLLALTHLLSVYGRTTDPSSTVDWIRRRFRFQWAAEFAFLVSTSLSVYPAVRRDLFASLDAERLRLGRQPSPLAWGTWFDILVNTLTRSIQRSRALGWSAIERGFRLDGPFTLPPPMPMTLDGWICLIIAGFPLILALIANSPA